MDQRTALARLADDQPYRHDLFIGLVAPIGSDRAEVTDALREGLGRYSYDVHPVRLADLLEKVPNLSRDPLPVRADRDYYDKRMNAGNRLRKQAGDSSALAAVGIFRARAHRDARQPGNDDAPMPAPPVAYIFDNLKNPREVELLRGVYGSAAWIVSVVQDLEERKSNLTDTLAAAENAFQVPEAVAVSLMARDAEDDSKHGQQVRDAFALADYFLPVRRGANWKPGVERFLQGVFGAPFLTPSAEEEAMRHAQAAALRSAAVGRQVGAVILPPNGAPHLLGANEVPKPGGGQYREGDVPDYRDFRTGRDPNPAYADRVIRELVSRFVDAGFFSDKHAESGVDGILARASEADATGTSPLAGVRAKALIEFTRCLHAEQAAIVDAARTGTAIAGARLFTTTFPCHECTKFILGAGIVEVNYIEPYPKSLAGDLYRDLIDARPPLETRKTKKRELKKVPYRPFLGFGPARFDDVFVAPQRKGKDGLARLDPATANPVGRGWSERAVREREDEVVVAIVAATEAMEPEASAAVAASAPPSAITHGPETVAGPA